MLSRTFVKTVKPACAIRERTHSGQSAAANRLPFRGQVCGFSSLDDAEKTTNTVSRTLTQYKHTTFTLGVTKQNESLIS